MSAIVPAPAGSWTSRTKALVTTSPGNRAVMSGSSSPEPFGLKGTASLADAVGLGAAIDYLDRVGMENIARREIDLLHYGTAALETVPGLRIIGTAREKVGVLSFVRS